jgi:TonB-linked SusC/RagA family outer membrane protein
MKNSTRFFSCYKAWLATALVLACLPTRQAGALDVKNILQSGIIKGKVVDDVGAPLPGVSVVVKGTLVGASSDADGSYSLAIPASVENPVIVFSFIGFASQEQVVNGRTLIDVTLAPDVQQLSEVVVVGYGTQKKSDITGSVASVSAKEISELPLTNVQQALQGRIAGVDVVSTGARPGAGVSVRIRGRRSFSAGNEPLYVVDGIPLAGGINDINPQDIQSMDVLKDASATAIYGSRGANGVVLITTKRGTTGKTIISYDGYYGVSSSLGKIDMMNGAQFAEYKRESRRTAGAYNDADPVGSDAKIFESTELEGIASGRSTDYQSLILKNGHQQSHQIGILGGSEKTKFAISGNYFSDVGIVPNQDFNRYSFRINIDHQISDQFKVGVSSLATFSIQNGDGFNPLPEALQNNPLGNPYNSDGTLNFLPTTDGLRTNPLSEIVKGAIVREDKRVRIFNSIYAEYQIVKGLSYRVNFGPDYQTRRRGEFNGRYTNARRLGEPTARTQNWNTFAYTLENVVNYTKTIGTDHNLTATGLYSIQQQTDEYFDTRVRGIPFEYMDAYNVGTAPIIEGVGSDYKQWTILSYMGRINYSFKDKYLITVTGRSDGSSRFSPGNKWGFFPSAALGWRISEENFLKSISFLSNLKLRASYGQTGNTGIDPYSTLGSLSRTTYAFGSNAANGYRPASLPNPDLKWETTASTNIGLDFGFFNGRIQGSLDVYQQNTSDLLMDRQLPATEGNSNFILQNVGKTKNQGIEISLSTVNIESTRGFQWSTDLNFYSNQEQIVELYGGKQDDIGNSWFIGKPLTVFYDYKKIGIWQTDEVATATSYQRKPGEIKVADLAGRDAGGNLVEGADGKINSDDRVILGSDIPDWTGGMTNRFSYKGFDLSFFLFTRQGSMIRSLFHNNYNNLFGRYNNLNVDYWTPTNPTNAYPRPNQNQEFPVYSSSMSYFDGSFVKVRNITFGYTVPAQLLKKFKLQSARIYASAQNPFIFATYRSQYKGIDPEFARTPANGRERTAEVDADTPSSMLILIGINLKM